MHKTVQKTTKRFFLVLSRLGFFVMLLVIPKDSLSCKTPTLSRKRASESVWHVLICFLLFTFCFNFFANNLNFSLLEKS